jgi:hypothetical protein
VSKVIEIEPLLVVAPDTSRAAKAAPSTPWPVRSTVPLLTKDFAVTESDAERTLLPINSVPLLVSVPPHRQARSAVKGAGVETDMSVVDERAGRRHSGLVVEPEQGPVADRSEPR